MSLEELKRKRELIDKKERTILSNMDMIIQENCRVAEVAHNAERIINDLDKEFEKRTGLDGLDVTFLLFATALQCARQYLLSNKKGRFTKDSEGSKPLKKIVPKQYHEILLGSVPYDAFRKSNNLQDINTGVSGVNHRYTVLGHDPLLGWFFGPLNILTDSVTKNNLVLESYRVINSKTIDKPVDIMTLVDEGYNQISCDYKLIIVAVIKQALHLGSDAFTKMGLPVPIINNVSPNLTSTLMKNGIDTYSISRGATLSVLINSIIAAIHGLFYNDEIYENKDIYEVKTRKILSYSNIIATTSNVIYVAMNAVAGNESALSKLDVGGMVVTIYRLVNDYEFIRKVKEEFVFGSFNKLIQGEEYNF
ncbi:hypothetical protein [Desulfitobacterium sp.]|uniref:hypothetical protein n=1 Tax=Desulfitobacterium sp. TaxID=49981 RepID=UPI002B20C71D|nr:hypothetical protein [Desulfitobacterium sp.]MEA4900716.1 hypothetical protein [Desulfitobacterium sp.]